MKYAKLNQQIVNDILECEEYIPFNTYVLGTCHIIEEHENIKIESIDNLEKESLIVTNKGEVEISNCDLNEKNFISIRNPSKAILKNNTLKDIVVKKFKILGINNNYIHELNIMKSIPEDAIIIDKSIIDNLIITDSIIKHGLFISIDSTIKNIEVIDSIIDNSRIINHNEIASMRPSYNNDNSLDLYEETFEDIATNSFKLYRSMVMNNNAGSDLGCIDVFKQKINIKEHVSKEGVMIAGYYNNKKGE